MPRASARFLRWASLMRLRTAAAYATEIRPFLANAMFAPARSRLLWLPLHLLLIAGQTAAIASGRLAWPVALLLSLLSGASFAGLTFVGHEALHGALVRGKRLRRIVGWLGFLPFAISPRLWEAWHNRVHHGTTNRPGADPDTYPTLHEYRQSLALRRVTDWFSPGRSRLAGVFSLLVGFSVQSSHVLATASKSGILSRAERRRALLESAAAWAVWLALLLVVGPSAFLFTYGIPLLVGNSIIMSMILTNHSLSPHTNVNDPLVNSLSVTGPRWVEWLTLGFGYHVEHHLFPAMSARHTRRLGELLRQRWPERYQSLPYFEALRALHRTPRVYQDDTTLLDPSSGKTWPTLGANGDSRPSLSQNDRRGPRLEKSTGALTTARPLESI